MASQGLGFGHVLCPTDFSEFSERALRHAAAVARTSGAELSVAYVCPHVLPLGGEVPYFTSEQLGSVARAELIDRLRAFVAPVVDSGMKVRTLLLEGDPSREIVRTAESLPVDLIVLGTHGRGGFERVLLGSVTEKVLRRSRCPVLTVCHAEGPPPGARAEFRRVLCATELRDESAYVLERAFALAETTGAELTVLHVLDGGPEFERGSPLRFTIPEVDALRECLERDALERLHRAVSAENRRRVAVRERVSAGRAWREIVRVAREVDAQLVVTGALGHGALDHVLFGSTSHHVVREAPCPVLIARPPRGDRASAPVKVA